MFAISVAPFLPFIVNHLLETALPSSHNHEITASTCIFSSIKKGDYMIKRFPGEFIYYRQFPMPAVLRENIQLLNGDRFASKRFTEKHLTKSTARPERLAWIVAI